MAPIGIIHSPYTHTKDIPIQGKFKAQIIAHIELKEGYAPGLKDLDGFSHAIILYYFHTSQKEQIVGKPFLEDKEHGIFAIFQGGQFARKSDHGGGAADCHWCGRAAIA